jgi:DNA-binding transcriptional LysR family regulator
MKGDLQFLFSRPYRAIFDRGSLPRVNPGLSSLAPPGRRPLDPVDLGGIDLNLLVSLRVLLTQRHVTRSAEKLGLTQPAVSASLARSRTLFRDKLLVRGPQGLVLTPRGEQILEQLNKVMEVTERLIAVPGEFTPETSNRAFALMGNDFVEFILLPSLMAMLATEAPNLQILFKSTDLRNIVAMMADSELDLAVGYLAAAQKELIRRIPRSPVSVQPF